jgi:radical SAM superfamily enzyme YgiQ (UPF0313 family)
MKVLLVNPRYPQTFWSFNRVLRMLGKKVLLPPLGLLTFAALLPRDWDLKLAELTIRGISEEEWDWCDLVLVSGMVSQCAGIIETLAESKRRGKTVAVGGPWVFHFPEDALRAGADVVVRGEGETAASRFLDALESKQSGIIIENNVTVDLAESPIPRYDLLDLRYYVDMAVQFSRGCPFLCEFCDITLMFGRKVRTKTPVQLLGELQTLYDLGWRRAVFFIDDNFIGNPPRARALLKELIPWMEERDYPFEFYTQASVNLANDPDLLQLMRRAGFYRVFLGIETPDQDSLERAKKFQNVSIDLDQACSKINKAGLQIIAGCMLGFDQEKPGADRRLIDLAVRNNIPEMFITLLQAGPGTDLWRRLKTEDRLLSSGYDQNFGSQTGLINFIPTRPIQEIVNEFTRLYEVLYDPAFYMERTFKHFAAMPDPPYEKGFSLPYLSEIRAVLITIVRQGILYRSRWTFWKYFLGALRKFPKRFKYFLSSCITAEHYYEYRRTIKAQLEAQLERADCSTTLPELTSIEKSAGSGPKMAAKC